MREITPCYIAVLHFGVLAQLKEQPVLDSPHKPPKARTEREME